MRNPLICPRASLYEGQRQQTHGDESLQQVSSAWIGRLDCALNVVTACLPRRSIASLAALVLATGGWSQGWSQNL